MLPTWSAPQELRYETWEVNFLDRACAPLKFTSRQKDVSPWRRSEELRRTGRHWTTRAAWIVTRRVRWKQAGLRMLAHAQRRWAGGLVRHWTACSGVLFNCFQCSGLSGLFNCVLCSFRLCSFSFFLFHAPTQKERKRTKRKKNAALGFAFVAYLRLFVFILFSFSFLFKNRSLLLFWCIPPYP